MSTTPSPAATAGRTLARVLKAVLSLLVLAVAVAGLPLLLAWATPIIWEAGHDDLTHLLDRQDTGSVFLLLLDAVGWTGWLQFTFCAVRELIAQVRGQTWHPPRGMGASQRATALLIGSILVLLPTSSALAFDAQAAPSATAPSLPGPKAQASQSAGADQVSPSSPANRPASTASYTVRETRPAESLWGIAKKELGDGERWREIADLNEGRTMTDGQVFRANSFLQPGWQLQMPDSSGAAGDAHTHLGDSLPAAGTKDEHVVTVRSGDYLSKIAEEEVGDGSAWPELFEASRGKPQPHGLPAISDPDVIYAGQHITVPGAETDQPPQERGHGDESGSPDTTPPAAQEPGGEQKPGTGQGEEQAPAPGHTAAPAPTTPAPRAPASHPAGQPVPPGPGQASPSAPAPPSREPSTSLSPTATAPAPAGPSGPVSSPAAASEQPAPSPAGSPLNLRIVLGAGALLAAAVTGALALRRTLQRRRRNPGEKIAITPQTSPAEAKLAAAAEPGGAARLDAALRTLAHHAARQKEEAVLPPLQAARIGTRTVEVLPDDDIAHQPQAPFTTGQGGWWALPADAALLDDEPARGVPAPYPALVTIGTTQAGDLLLLNLARLPALLLDGNPLHITEVCTSLALELAMSPWANEVEVITVGFGEDLPQLLPTTRIAHIRHPAHALRDLGERLLEAHQVPETRHQPYLLLCTSTLEADTAWEIADLIDKARTVPVTLIAPASTTAAHFPQAPILNASLSAPQHLHHIDTDITVQRLQHTAYQQITTALKVSAQPSHPAAGPWQNVPDEPARVQEHHQPPPKKPTGPAPSTATNTPPQGSVDVSGEVFPALLAATTDPSGLRLLSPAAPSSALSNNAGPDTGPATPSVPASPSTADTTDAAKTANADGPAAAAAAEEPAATEAQECEAAHDLHAPQIRVLGPVEVTGVDSTGHGPKMAQLAALLHFRPGRRADVLCADMDPASPWTVSTLNARLQGLRRSLGNDPAGNPYVPRRSSAETPYGLAPGVHCDWNRFLQLAEHALPQGPAGLPHLEKALTLVRGKPFGGRPLPWAEPYAQEMTTRIIDVAHTVATHRTPTGPHHDLNAARRAVTTGLDVDPTAELLYRDWMRLEAARGNRSGLHTAITRLQQVNQALDCSLETETTHLINQLLNSQGTAVRKAF
ncbi:LysM peptidoglycan-binding domain-containing protein [Streptomyces bobili]